MTDTKYPAHELLKRDDWHLIIAPSDLRKEFSDVLAELAILQKDKESFKTMLKETEQHRSDIEKFLEDEDLSIDEFKGIWEENAKLRAELALKNPAVGDGEALEKMVEPKRNAVIVQIHEDKIAPHVYIECKDAEKEGLLMGMAQRILRML